MDIFKTKELVALFNDPLQIGLLLGLGTILGFIIAGTYHRTHRGYSFSQNFTNTLILMTVITTFIIMIIGDNIASAIGIFGAFSIVRFRTAVKDARDIAFVFFALASGLSVGTGSIAIGVIGTLFLSALIFILHSINFGGPKNLDYVLNFRMDASIPDQKIFKGLFNKYVKNERLLHVESKEKGKVLVFSFSIALSKEAELNEFINKLSVLKGISDVRVANSKNDLDF